MTSKRRWKIALLAFFFALGTLWFFEGSWPDPSASRVPWKPDAILILGGGDTARARQAKRLADDYPDIPLVVTGDGGDIVNQLHELGISDQRIIHEQSAKSTYQNAKLTDPILKSRGVRRVVLVTNWFHVPRALAIFRHEQPFREFVASFEPKPEPLTPWDRNAQRRERFASVMYLFRYGIWSW
jgi:uncharacterized SAM-binding protein YcdF (DUF218 family)